MISFQKSFCSSLAILTLLHWLCLCTFGKWAKTVGHSPHHAPHMYINSLWLLWSCCYMDVPTLGHLQIPGGLVVRGTVRTKWGSYLPNTVHVVSLWWYIWIMVAASGSHCPHWRQMLLRCVLMTWGKFDFKFISRFALEIQQRYPWSGAQFRGLYTSQWCRHNLVVSSHKFLDSHHILMYLSF